MKIYVAAIIATLAACTSDDGIDLTGVYQVTAEASSMPCGTDVPITDGRPYLHFHKEDFLGQKYFVFDECNDAAATDCPSTGSLFSGFVEPISHGWKGHVTSWSGSNGTCGMSVGDSEAILAGNTLSIDITNRSGEITLPASECTEDAPDEHVDELTCDEHHAFTAVRLGE